VALLMLAFVTPALINKNPARRAPDFHPLAVWLGAILLFGIASALHGMWGAVAVDGTMAVLTAMFAIRGGGGDFYFRFTIFALRDGRGL